MHSVSNHQKTITCMTFDGSKTRLLTGSLDHHVKVYDLTDFKVAHSVKYPAPVLSIGMSPNDTHLVVGMANGSLSIRERSLNAQEEEAIEERVRGGTYTYFMRGIKSGPEKGDLTIEHQKKLKLKKYDKLIKSFEYGKALDSALSKQHTPLVAISVLEELMYRDGLSNALGARDDTELEPISRFIFKHISNPRYCKLLVKVTDIVLGKFSFIQAKNRFVWTCNSS